MSDSMNYNGDYRSDPEDKLYDCSVNTHVEKSHIQETPNLSINADSSTDTFSPLFFIRRLQIMDEFSLGRQS